MSSHFNKQRVFHPHEAFATFGGLLLVFSLARLIGGTFERYGTTTSAWIAVVLAGQFALVLFLMAHASAKRAGRKRVFVLSSILVGFHFLVYGLVQVIRPIDPAVLEGVSLMGTMLFHFTSASVAYWLACVMIFERRWELMVAAIAPAGMMAFGAWRVLGELPTGSRIAWAIGSGLALIGTGGLLFWLSHLPAVRAVFANRPTHYLMKELMNAKRVHESLFPDPYAGDDFRFGYAYRPMRQIGGDFIHAHRSEVPDVPSGDGRPEAFFLTMVDVTGHGISSALTVNRLNAELQQYFASRADPCPSEVLGHLNDYVLVTMAEHGLFATAVCVRVDMAAGTLSIANAGHPPCFFRSETELRLIEAEGPMLGVFPRELFEAEPVSFAFQPGERLIVLTDGAIEARSVAGEMLGSKRLQNLVDGACKRCVPPVRDPKTEDLLQRKMPGRLLDRSDVHKPVGLIQQVMRQRMNAHPCTLADEIMLSIDDFVQQECQDDILIATVELLQAKRMPGPAATHHAEQGENAEAPGKLQASEV